jgi:hypothetical protein
VVYKGLAEVLESRDHRFILNENPRRNSERRMAMVERTMDPLAWLRKQLEEPDVDLLR